MPHKELEALASGMNEEIKRQTVVLESCLKRIAELEALLREAQIYCPSDPVQNLIGNRISSALSKT